MTQTVQIDLEIGVPGTAVFESDKVADTIDYEQVALRIRALAASGHFRLVETFADRIAALLMNDGALGQGERGQARHPGEREVRRRHDRATSTGLTLSTRARSARSFTSRPRRPPLM